MSVALVACVFMAMGGVRRMDAHSSTSHGAHFAHIIAGAPTDVADPHAGHHGASAAADHEDAPQEEPSSECTCVGPCQGGAAPSAEGPRSFVAVAPADLGLAPQVARSTHRVYRDPTSHLLPLPNAPPAHV